MAGNFFKGTSTDQDLRFGDKQRKLIMSRQWPELFDKKVDIKKIDMETIKQWVDQKVQNYIGIEDEVVQRQIVNYLEQQADEIKGPDPKELTILITGYFEKNAMPFMTDLWNLLLSAQDQQNGVAIQIQDQKQQQLQRKKEQLQRLQQKYEQMKQAIDYVNKKIKKNK
ncbi:hypothetical protein pb186bvf_000908 [Paramecium bursaria]